MATIEKRVTKSGKITYRAKIRRKNHRPLTATLSTKADAKRWVAENEAAILSGRHFHFAESKHRTLAQAIAKYIPRILCELKDASGRIKHLAWWESEIGHLPLGAISPALLVECREKLLTETPHRRKNTLRPRSHATVNRYLASLSALMTYAVREWQWLDKNPVNYLKKLKEPKGRCRYLSQAELACLLEVLNQPSKYPEMRPIILLAMTTGMRRGEILGLRWKDIDFQRQRIILPKTKNDDTRAVPLVGPALEALREWSRVMPINRNSLIYPSRGKSGAEKPFDMNHAWNQIRSNARLLDFRFHDLRHTAASFLAMSGATLREIGDIIGHKTLAMVQRYAHLTDDHKYATVERMIDQMFKEAI
jgi:integrase